jgi:hypothetical protein
VEQEQPPLLAAGCWQCQQDYKLQLIYFSSNRTPSQQQPAASQPLDTLLVFAVHSLRSRGKKQKQIQN